MKKILFIIILLFISGMCVSKAVYAVVETPKPITSPSQGDIQQIDDLKNRIASRVAQLNLVEKRGIIGTVTDATNSQITITDVNNNIRFVDVDELTKFSNPNVSGSTFGISDITKNMKLGILGLYNKQSRRILARQIDVLVLPSTFIGAVYSIDGKNFNFYIVSEDNKQTFIDVENITKTYSYSSGAELASAGFSKITVNESIAIIGFPDKQNPSHIIASRIILLPDVPKNPKINFVPALNPGTGITPSTGSGRKLTPILR